MNGLGSERGVALLVVLWVVVVLGVLAGEIVVPTRFDSATTFNERCRSAGHYAARAGVADAAERLRGLVAPGADGGPAGFLPPPGEGGSPARIAAFTGAVPEAVYRVEVEDLNARANVNRMDAAGLRALIESAEPAVGAAALSDAILDWIDPDGLRRAQGAEADAYGGRSGPRNGPIPALDELLLVRGMTPEILYGPTGRPVDPAAGLDRFLTVDGSGRINLNSAPPEVLATLPGFAPDIVALVVELRRERPIGSVSELAAEPRLSGGPLRLQDFAVPLLAAATTRSEEVRVESTGEGAGCAVAGGIDAIVAVGPDGPVVRGWRERVDPAADAGAGR